MYLSKEVYAVILAGGSGERFGDELPKQFKKVAGKTVIEHTLSVFDKNSFVDKIIIVVHPAFRWLLEEILLRNHFGKVWKILNGGNTRQESSKIGVFSISNDDSYVLIHDAVRPFVTHAIIQNTLNKLENYEAVDVCVPSSDTIVKVDGEEIIEVPDRRKLMLGQTPQGFRTAVIKKAYKLYEQEPFETTDDCSLLVRYKLGRVGIVRGDRFNIKITYPEDIYFADKIFQVRSTEATLTSEEEIAKKIRNKVLIVFGASRGIGKEIVGLAEKYGARTYGFSRSTGVDVCVPEQVALALDTVYKKEGRIDFVVNTAAILRMGTLECRTYDDILQEIMTNYFGTITVAKESIKYLKQSNGSLLFFTSSSYTRGRSLYSVYSSTKAAIVNLMQALAEEFAPYSCRVNAINPERTNTEMRKENFGNEDERTLLSPKVVAMRALAILVSEFTGMVFDVRKSEGEFGM